MLQANMQTLSVSGVAHIGESADVPDLEVFSLANEKCTYLNMMRFHRNIIRIRDILYRNMLGIL